MIHVNWLTWHWMADLKKNDRIYRIKLTDWITRTGDYVRIARDLTFSGWDLMVEMYKEEVYT
ncbi:hypothetical protein CMK22_18735 [Candidatus Poribacteria bacterium]|nr:hypothetical protein [Candidatus Poribacteria bacterium]